MSRNDRSSRDLQAAAAGAASHPKKYRHQPRGCGGGPAVPGGLTITFDTVDAGGRHHRLRAEVTGDRVTDARQYRVNLQVSKDGGTTWLEPWRHHTVPDELRVGFTAAAATDTFTADGHGFGNGDAVQLHGGALPDGVVADETYYVRDKTADTFKLADRAAGDAIELDANGHGTVDVNGTTFSAEFHAIRRAYKYRYRARAEGDPCKGDWGPGTSADPVAAGAGWSIAYDPNDPETPPTVTGLTLDIDEHRAELDWTIPPDPIESNLPDLRIVYETVEVWKNALDTGTLVASDLFHHGDHKSFKIKKPGSATYFARIVTVSASGVTGTPVTTSATMTTPSTSAAPAVAFDVQGPKHSRYRALVTASTVSDTDANVGSYVLQLAHAATGPSANPPAGTKKKHGRVEGNATGDDLVEIFRGIPKNHNVWARELVVDTRPHRSAWSAWTAAGRPKDSSATSTPGAP